MDAASAQALSRSGSSGDLRHVVPGSIEDAGRMQNHAPLFRDVASEDFLGFQFGGKTYQGQLEQAMAKTQSVCAIECEMREIRGMRVVWLSQNFKFMGGSLGCAEGEKICCGLELARVEGIPAVIECRSGGARMQEGTLSLMQMAKVSVAVQALKDAGIPFISICLDPTYGGVSASYAMQGDVRIGTKDARIGFAGPAVILNTVYEMDQHAYDTECPSGFQSGEYLRDHGQLDIVLDSEDEVEACVGRVLHVMWSWRSARYGSRPGSRAPSAPGTPSVRVSSRVADLTIDARERNPELKTKRDYTLSRKMTRPQPQDILENVFSDFVQLYGDGRVGSDTCLRGGLAFFEGNPCVVMATFKGHDPNTMKENNFGMANPHGYRLAHRLFDMAERLSLPVFTLVDTPGAYPSFQSEADGQSEALATNLTRMAGLHVPIITLVVGEGGSGGALGVAMGNRIGMLSRAYYSVISPEGAASILGRYQDDADKAARFPTDCQALAATQHVYADQLKELGVIDEILWEAADLGDAEETNTSFPLLSKRVREFFLRSLTELRVLEPRALVVDRYVKFRRMGKVQHVTDNRRKELTESPMIKTVASRGKSGADTARPSKTLLFLAEQTLNSPHSVHQGKAPAMLSDPVVPDPALPAIPRRHGRTAKEILDAEGPEAVRDWVLAQKRVLVTDTTMRDAHQSLLATRVRTVDLLGSCREHSRVLGEAFSFEVWGGATFDVSYRFLHEDPWERLRLIRAACPTTCLQMLLRGSNAVGYTSYQDNVIEQFVRLAAKNGIDVFRIFDCFNDLEQMRLSIQSVRKAGKIAEVCICFTGNFLREDETIYTLEYYKDLARAIDAAGAHILAIKDMAGLLVPQAAAPLMEALRSVTKLPIHYHCHNTSSANLATCLNMAEAGCDIIDFAIASMADTTSQPSLNAFVSSMANHERATGIDYMELEPLDMYWQSVRDLYAPFESGLKNGTARVYDHQIPGGQYSNLIVQCKSLGLWDQWDRVLDMYRDVNRMFGDVVKVTPSSKCVGDMALFMLRQDLTVDDIVQHGDQYEYPDSVISLFRGELGRPHRGLPAQLTEKILKGARPLDRRPGELLPPLDIAQRHRELEEKYSTPLTEEDVCAAILYPKVFDQYMAWLRQYGGKTSNVPTRAYWYGMQINQEISLTVMSSSGDVAPSVARIKLRRIGPLQQGSMRTLKFEVNGSVRSATVQDKTLVTASPVAGKPADRADPRQVPSPMPGNVEQFLVPVGTAVTKGQRILMISAMKMEVMVPAPHDGIIKEFCVDKGERVDQGTLVAMVEPAHGDELRRTDSLADLTSVAK